MRANNVTALLLAAMSVASGARVSAHRLDEYLQAARIAIEPDRVQLELNLTPGIAVVDDIIREIDQDENGVLSQHEQRTYARRVLSAMTLQIDDDTPVRLEPAASTFPAINAMRNGEGTIAIQADVVVPLLPVGPHHLFFHNGNADENDVYLANALVPANDQVGVTGQRRDGDQSELTIDFVVRSAPATSGQRWVWICFAGGVALATPLIRRTRIRRG